MKASNSKWVRYFNIILGVPNKKHKTTKPIADTIDNSYATAEPAGRQIKSLRADETGDWQLKTDLQNSPPVIQNCEQSF